MSNCTTIRRKLVRHGTMNLASGETTMTRSEWVTEFCNVPIFGDRKQTVCKSCLDGWSVEGNRPATFEEATAARDALEAKSREAGKALAAISGGGPMNLTPDHVKASPEWKALHRANTIACDALRDFNRVFVKTFAKELRAERRKSRRPVSYLHADTPEELSDIAEWLNSHPDNPGALAAALWLLSVNWTRAAIMIPAAHVAAIDFALNDWAEVLGARREELASYISNDPAERGQHKGD